MIKNKRHSAWDGHISTLIQGPALQKSRKPLQQLGVEMAEIERDTYVQEFQVWTVCPCKWSCWKYEFRLLRYNKFFETRKGPFPQWPHSPSFSLHNLILEAEENSANQLYVGVLFDQVYMKKKRICQPHIWTNFTCVHWKFVSRQLPKVIFCTWFSLVLTWDWCRRFSTNCVARDRVPSSSKDKSWSWSRSAFSHTEKLKIGGLNGNRRNQATVTTLHAIWSHVQLMVVANSSLCWYDLQYSCCATGYPLLSGRRI